MAPGCTAACPTLSSTFFYSAGADRVQILELCVTSGVRPSDKIGGRPAGPSPWVVNHRKVILADKDAVLFGQECYISDVPRMLLFPFLGLENGVQLDSPGSMKPTGYLRDGKGSMVPATGPKGRKASVALEFLSYFLLSSWNLWVGLSSVLVYFC